MKALQSRKRLLLSATSVAIAAATVPAAPLQAQTAGNTDDQVLSEVIVTGSYIPRTDSETVSPVTVISAADIANSGLTTVADVVRTLSADNSGTLPSSFPGAFAAGASGIALRGLTVNSTLVLIDGLRAADYALPDDGIRSFVDLNSIPIGTIERIEVLKDGASSTYGADAIGGVVNVILKKQFQGFTSSVEVGDSQHGGGFEKHFDFTGGHGDLATDHYNAYISAEYQIDNAIGVWQRGYPFNDNDYQSIGGGNFRPNPDIGAGSTFGSVTPGTLLTPGNVPTGVPLPGAVSQPLHPCSASAPLTVSASGNAFCNQNQLGYLEDQPPTERLGLSGRFTVQLSDTMQGYLSASYYQNQSHFATLPPAQIQTSVPNLTTDIALPATIPGPTPGSAPVLNPNDPFAAAGQAAVINYAFGQLGPLTTAVKNHDLRLVGDISGQWAGWDYDGSFVINHTWLDNELSGNLNFTQLVKDVTNGTYNFINPAANSPAVLSALAPRLVEQDTSDMDTVVLRVNRSLFNLAGGPLGVAVGTEWRYEAQFDPNINATSQVQQLGYSQAIGSRNVGSVDAEIDAPVLKSLELTASGRFDHYSDFGTAATPKVGFKFKPLEQVALRGTFSRGFRAPSFAENGSSLVEGFIPGYSACPSPLCTAHGADGYINSYTLGELNTANPLIKPETSHSFTLGLVVEPVKQFNASFDYYYIKKNNLITEPNQAPALSQYNSAGTVPAGFSIIVDNPDSAFPTALPRIVTIASPFVNAASEYTDGFDVDLRGKFDLGSAGKFSSDLSASKIISFVYEQAGAPALQYAGFQSPFNLSSGAGTPQWRGTWTNTWAGGPFRVSAIVYYVGSYKMYGQDILGVSSAGNVQYVCLSSAFDGFPARNCRVASFTDTDLTGSYDITRQLQVSLGIENLFDLKPPFDPPNYGAVNFNPTYTQAGIIGRFFRLGVHFKL
jgi:iron complex outermembrane recepter protein